MPELECTVTCPSCGSAHVHDMPENACVRVLPCRSCGARLRPRAGDCCVFCSYGNVRCPPEQEARAA